MYADIEIWSPEHPVLKVNINGAHVSIRDNHFNVLFHRNAESADWYDAEHAQIMKLTNALEEYIKTLSSLKR
jgi:hypothetical protein